jgi:hypothetical protein
MTRTASSIVGEEMLALLGDRVVQKSVASVTTTYHVTLVTDDIPPDCHMRHVDITIQDGGVLRYRPADYGYDT